MGATTSSQRAASGALRDLNVLTVAGGDGTGAREVVALLQASGMSTSTVVQADLVPDALEQLDAIVMCGASASATAKLASEIRLQDSSPRVVAVLQSVAPKQLRELLGAGVDGIVLEAEATATLVVTVRAVCAGQLVVPRDLWQRLARPGPVDAREAGARDGRHGLLERRDRAEALS